ncbi:restriction endonuclease subunit S [Ligilactobacillus murinus]|uniref:restriction endonuclease subunit S n=2 Tax=Ligilactobacillus murinus TaxID=1622 RepID=UPI001C3DA953|nr:restriction endonuclease subunit S [Ligilactobacillus murinus]MCR1880118.1 restriction endonuclease subunit S [Ligilactobacillus murinus]WET88729.1 restriction endonuclease subunit S [Ligilactobacillus murinus]
MIDTKVLREKILDLAMRGKLVPQDPNDEPASELLKRIKAEKEELIKQKKIKRDKNETEIFKGDDGLHYEKFADGTVKKLDVPYELPDGWEWAKLGSYMDVRDGTHDTPKYFDSGIPFVTSKNLGDGKIDFKNVNYISDEDSQKFNQRSRVEAGDILMAMIGTIGKPVVAPKVEFEYSIKNVALFKRLTIEQNSKFIRDYLQYSEKRLRKCASGGNQKFLSLKKLKEILIPIPPSSEQKQIVSVLSDYLSLVECIDSDQNALQQLASQLKQKVLDIAMQGKLVPQDPNDEPASVLLEKIRAEKQRLYEEGKIKKKDLVETEIVKDGDNAYYQNLPKGWGKTLFGNIVYLLSGRDLSVAKYSDSVQKGIPYITGASNFCDGIITTSRFTEFPTVISEKKDILITVKGTVGELAVNPYYKAHIARQIMAIRPYLVNNEFLKIYLETKIDNMKLQSQSMIPGISREVLLKLLIALPPKTEQLRITNLIKKLFQEFEEIT